MTRRRVLVLHYFFPPLGGAGVPRILKFVKYLGEFGWDAAVVTSSLNVRWYGPRDEGRLADVPASVLVTRARELPSAPLRRKLFGPLYRLGFPQASAFIAWPDETVGWLPFATLAADRVAERWRPDVVMSSSYPYSGHIAALALSRRRGIPWVADFRDPWTCNPQPETAPLILRKLNRRAEQMMVERASRVIVVDPRLELVGLANDDPRRVVIPNGVDEADFDGATSAGGSVTPERFRLTYVGSLYGTRDAAPVFDAIRRLARAGVIDPQRFEVSLIGNVWLGDHVLDLGVVPLRCTGYVEHGRAASEMREATALLFYAPASTWAPSGKIFEYLVSGRPILSVARRDNLAYQLVDELDAGEAAEPSDPGGIERAIGELYRRWLDGTLAISPDVRGRTLARFSRRRLTAQLAAVLDAVADGRAP
jgi:glycosyltransferase involved in cell wall biosynthesis